MQVHGADVAILGRLIYVPLVYCNLPFVEGHLVQPGYCFGHRTAVYIGHDRRSKHEIKMKKEIKRKTGGSMSDKKATASGKDCSRRDLRVAGGCQRRDTHQSQCWK